MTDPRFNLRPAGAADGQIVLAMVDAMADVDKMPHLDAAAQDRLLHDAFVKKRVEIVLAEWEGEPVGYAAYFEAYSTFEARPTLYIDDLFVLPAYRGRHVAYELFRYCLKEAKKRACGRVDWLVLESNQSAFGFYDHLHAKKLQKWIPFRLTREDIDRMA